MQNSKVKFKTQKFYLRSLADTQQLAARIAAKLHSGEVLALTGPLGSGKTTFVQYLAKALGVKRSVRSPSFIVLQTFTINSKFKMQNSKVKLKTQKLRDAPLLLCHIDAYRLKSVAELEAIGLYDYLGRPGVITVIEWAEKIRSVLPTNVWQFIFNYQKGNRRVEIRSGRAIRE